MHDLVYKKQPNFTIVSSDTCNYAVSINILIPYSCLMTNSNLDGLHFINTNLKKESHIKGFFHHKKEVCAYIVIYISLLLG